MIAKLGRRLNLRQIALASAEVYLTRFLLKVLLKEVNAYMLVATCLYVACKMEEFPQHIRLVLSEARNLWPEYIPQDTTKLAEFEFYLVEEMELYLIIYHPYNSLLQIKNFLADNTSTYGVVLSDDDLQNSWSIINDSYITDLHLLYPPHIIAIASLYITIVVRINLNESKKTQTINTTAESMDGADGGSLDQMDSNMMHMEDLMMLANMNASVSPVEVSRAPDLFSAPSVDSGFSSSVKKDPNKIQGFMQFLDHSHVNLDEVVDSIQEIVNLYILWNGYNENIAKKALHNMIIYC